MAIRGRPPKPTLEKIMTGNPGGHKLNPLEPKPEGDAQPPSTLSKGAQRVWYRIVAMQAAGLYKIVDEVLLAAFCEAEALRLELAAELSIQPKMVKGSMGQMVVNPLIKAVNDQVRLIKDLSQDLGLSPRARHGLSIDDKPKKVNKFTAVMGGQISIPDHLQ